MLRAVRIRFVLVLLALFLGVSEIGQQSLRVSTAEAAPALESASLGPVAQTGAADIGQFGGECFPWVQRVVQEATGITIGPDYRVGYLEAGAIEVPLTNAQHGDIIQLADDRDTAPTADYPGLHTAIVLDNVGSGKFRVLESNANFDGIVGVRDNWAPLEAASRHPGISVHVYRLPASPTNSAPADAGGAITGPPASLVAGAIAVVVADGDCLRVRAVAGLRGEALGCVPTGERVTVAQVGEETDGFRWALVNAGSLSGWVADKYLRRVVVDAGAAESEPPKPPSTAGRIVAGSVPSSGIGLLIYGGGSAEQLISASGCPLDALAFWASVDGRFVPFIPAATVAVVNAAWNARFGEGLPASTALIARCGAGAGSLTAAAPEAAVPPEAKLPAVPASSPPDGTLRRPAIYAVVEGDTLSRIAARLCPAGVDLFEFMEELLELNGIGTGDVLTIGKELRLPVDG
jgi:hypothetical protein